MSCCETQNGEKCSCRCKGSKFGIALLLLLVGAVLGYGVAKCRGGAMCNMSAPAEVAAVAEPVAAEAAVATPAEPAAATVPAADQSSQTK